MDQVDAFLVATCATCPSPWTLHMVKKHLAFLVATTAVLLGTVSHGAEPDSKYFKGVVTYHLIPANVMRVNEIVEDPEPGTSYIGNKGILLEIDRDIDLRANWTVVEVEYHEYQEPKTIQYEMLSEKHEITVKFHALSVAVDGDISEYIEE